jgi:hypothetical protein
MSIRLVCPACQHPHFVSETRLETTIRCKHCGKPIPVTAGQASDDDEMDEAAVFETSDDDDEPEVVFPSDETPRARRRIVAKRGIGRIVWVIVGLAFAGALCLALCCGGLGHFGFKTMAEEVRVQLEADRRFTTHVGQIQTVDIEVLASIADAEDDVWYYSVAGTKWSGRISVHQETNDAGAEQISWVRFTLANGEKVELKWPDPGPDPADAADKPQRD